MWLENGSKAFDLIAKDPKAAPLVRMFAIEVMHRNEAVPSLSKADEAAAYLKVLTTRALDADNPWGDSEHLGPLSERVIACGKDAIPALKPILKDKRLLFFQGPRPELDGKDKGPRLKDLAVSMVCMIQGWDEVYGATPRDRDIFAKSVLRGLGK